MSDEQTPTLAGFEKTELITILEEQLYPLTTKQVRSLLKSKGIVYPEYIITRSLRELIAEDKVRFKGGRWMRPALHTQLKSPRHGYAQNTLDMPELSVEGTKSTNIPQQMGPKSSSATQDRGPWTLFRQLLAYYLECIRDEGGADAYSYQDKMGKEFVYINGTGNWYPQAGKKWNFILPLGDHIHDLQKSLAGKDDNLVVLGYPIEAYKNKTPEGEYTLLRPVFYYVLDTKFTEGSISFSMDNPQPEISAEWMKYALKNHAEQYHFLSACGLINQPRPADEAPGFSSFDMRPGLHDLASTLAGFLPKRVKERLAIRSVTGDILPTSLKSGIYNRAVIMVASRTKYTQTLIRELHQIEKQPDSVLGQTSLKHIFSESKLSDESLAENDIIHESSVADLFPLNSEQRDATASLLKNDISVVTGPPGTGKSQVVVSAVANARIFGQSVLFTSRNHKAIDAVYDRAKDRDGNHLIARANSKDDPTVKYSFSMAVNDLLNKTIDQKDEQKFSRKVEQLERRLSERGETGKVANTIQNLRDDIGSLEEELSWLSEKLDEATIRALSESEGVLPIDQLEAIDILLATLLENRNHNSFLKKVRWLMSWLRMIRSWRKLRKQIYLFTDAIEISSFPPYKDETIGNQDIDLFRRITRFLTIQKKIIPLQDDLHELPPLETLVEELTGQNELVNNLAEEALILHTQIAGGLEANSPVRESIASLRAALRSFNRSFDSESEKQEVLNELVDQVPLLVKKFPSWAVTNLSVGSKTPLVQAMFDLAIIDEASQCDIASAIPILFRAKRAAVVGDPNQLKHVHNLTLPKDSLFRKKAGLSDLKSQRFSYRETSLYDLFAQTNSVRPHMLRDTYRSSSGIAEYSNSVFYDGALRVATDENNLVLPKGTKAGIHWTDVAGEIRSAGRSGCVSDREIEQVYDLVYTILVKNNFAGSVGVVTPFRIQANRLRDRIFEGEIPYALLQNANVVIDTSHGFQGDEKDVMIFSLCSGPDMPDGSRFFIRDSANLFNVAVSRARAVLHVVGNKKWAINSNIPHISALATPMDKKGRTTENSTPWSPYESPWEKRLAEELITRGMDPIPQYPVSGRRLDLALVDKERGIYIDIEVDGDQYHRNPDGSRKKDDLWRDITVQGHGWQVKRFWVYRLKENMTDCISEIESAWRKHD